METDSLVSLDRREYIVVAGILVVRFCEHHMLRKYHNYMQFHLYSLMN